MSLFIAMLQFDFVVPGDRGAVGAPDCPGFSPQSAGHGSL